MSVLAAVGHRPAGHVLLHIVRRLCKFIDLLTCNDAICVEGLRWPLISCGFMSEHGRAAGVRVLLAGLCAVHAT